MPMRKPLLHRLHHSLRNARACAVAAFIACALLVFAAHAEATISGVCPDGSIFIVQSMRAIPCSDAKQVEPSDIPPLNPELLPTPYGWQHFQGRQDPNNPYNVVDSVPTMRRVGRRQQRGPRDFQQPEFRTPEAEAGNVGQGPPVASALQPLAGGAPFGVGTAPGAEGLRQARPHPLPAVVTRRGANLSFSEQDLRDLMSIVELSQRRAPATFAAHSGGLELSIAHSASFEPRLRAVMQSRGGLPPGPVLLFSVSASGERPFYGNLTFVQGGVVYHPNREEARDLGMLRGSLGMVGGGDGLLGYARLPEGIDLSREIDVYWNDRLLSATLNPS